MDVHQIARTTPPGRRLMARRQAEDWSVAAVAAAFGVDPKTVRKWQRRHAAEGEAGLADRLSRPPCSPTRPGEPAEAEIEAIGPRPIPRRYVSRTDRWRHRGRGTASARPRSAQRARPEARGDPLPAEPAGRADPYRLQG
jgi:hypothetical protein